MSYISDRYGVPEATVKQMIRNGIISCSWEGYEDVYRLWKEGKTNGQIVETTGRSRTLIYNLTKMFKNS